MRADGGRWCEVRIAAVVEGLKCCFDGSGS